MENGCGLDEIILIYIINGELGKQTFENVFFQNLTKILN